ncbi:hypothetical protein [Sphingomonas sp. BK235]|uniref:hypothetical protein n=1 Tax=Sphingomonas sp. BK235 TaxID=2512131 RepID=UPI001FB69977|nr:hypothetical protein [Sphingomonas sp. BK235]
MFDKMRRVNQAAIVDNKHLGAALAMAQAIQAAAPHHAKRNNSEPARSSGSIGVFARPSPGPAAGKIDRRRLCTPKLKPAPRLSNEELVGRGLGEFAR